MTQPVEISLEALSPPPLVLTISDSLKVTIPSPGVRTVAELYVVEKSIIDSAQQAEADPDAFLRAQERASDFIVSLIRKHEPKVPEDLDLPLETIMALIRSIIQGPSVAAEIQSTIIGSGIVDEAARAKQREQADEAAVAAGKEPGKDPRPLASKKRSSKRSSASAKTTAGRQSGGSARAARGPRSRSTSQSRSVD